MTDFLRPSQPTEADQASGNLASEQTAKQVGPMPATPLDALPAEPVQNAGGEVTPQSTPPSNADALHMTEAKPMRPFERMAVPKASVKNGEEHDGEIKKKKKISSLFTRFYLASFLFVICGAIIGGYLLLDPLIRSLKNTNKMIAAHQKESEDVTAYLNSVKDSIAAAQSIPPDILKKVDQAMPRDVDEPRLLATMEAFGTKTGISLDSVQFSAGSASQNQNASTAPIPSGSISTLQVNPINIGLNVVSPSYAEARVFLESIEQSIPLLDVSRIGVSGDAMTGEFTYQLQMKTYSLVKADKPPVVTTPAATPAAGSTPSNDINAP
jgi:hypothetical protein